MKRFLITIRQRHIEGAVFLPVTAACAVDALLSVMDRLPFNARVTCTPL